MTNHEAAIMAAAQRLAGVLEQDPAVPATRLALGQALQSLVAAEALDIFIELVRGTTLTVRDFRGFMHHYQLAYGTDYPNYQAWTRHWDEQLQRPKKVDLEEWLGAPSALRATVRNRTSHDIVIPLPVQIRMFEDPEKASRIQASQCLNQHLPESNDRGGNKKPRM